MSQPCKIHESEGITVPSVWLITSQDQESGFPPGETFYVCFECLAGLVMSQLQAMNPEAFQAPAEAAEAAQETVDAEVEGYDALDELAAGEPEPEPEEYDPGPEVDDEGGMSEYRHAAVESLSE